MAQNLTREDQLKAAFLYNFTQFVEWPSQSFSSTNAPIVIAVYGNNPFGNVLEELVKGEVIAGHPLRVKYFSAKDPIPECHVLFISKTNTDWDSILKGLRNKNVLAVSDSENFLEKGGMIRFYTSDNKLKFEINLDVAQQEDFKISSKLLKMASIY